MPREEDEGSQGDEGPPPEEDEEEAPDLREDPDACFAPTIKTVVSIGSSVVRRMEVTGDVNKMEELFHAASVAAQSRVMPHRAPGHPVDTPGKVTTRSEAKRLQLQGPARLTLTLDRNITTSY